jgi:hypothetical protein
MVNNNSENTAQTGPGAGAPAYKDWREQRWEWRRQRREARHNYPFHGIFPGLLLILLGGLFLSVQQGWISGSVWWQYLLIGMGVISIVDGIFQYRAPAYRYWGRSKFVWGTALIIIGALFLLGFSQWWPVVLIGAGIAILLRFMW